MKFVLTIVCDNAAFERNPMLEVASIIREVADTLVEDSPSDPLIWDTNLRDTNGNTVGMAEFCENDKR